jgi:hypothetical protein
MTNEDLATKISSQIAALEGTMKGAIDGKVAELEAAMTRMRTSLQGQIDADLTKIDRNFQITCEQDAQLQDRVAKLEQAKTTWGERGKQMGMGMVGAGIVLGATALIDWAFSGPNTVQSQQ